LQKNLLRFRRKTSKALIDDLNDNDASNEFFRFFVLLAVFFAPVEQKMECHNQFPQMDISTNSATSKSLLKTAASRLSVRFSQLAQMIIRKTTPGAGEPASGV